MSVPGLRTPRYRGPAALRRVPRRRAPLHRHGRGRDLVGRLVRWVRAVVAQELRPRLRLQPVLVAHRRHTKGSVQESNSHVLTGVSGAIGFGVRLKRRIKTLRAWLTSITSRVVPSTDNSASRP